MRTATIALILLLLFCGHGLWAQDKFSTTTGEGMYAIKCAVCHNGTIKEAPKFESLQLLSPTALIKAMTTGVMKAQAATLSAKEKQAIATYISKTNKKQSGIIAGKCNLPTNQLKSKPQISNWGMGLGNHRFTQTNLINAKNVENLTLKWAFAFPEATRARSQPTVVGQTLFTASQHGVVYALDTQTGCIRWAFQAEDEIRSAIIIGTDKNGYANRLYFGDFKANVYALDIQTQRLLWKKKIDTHSQATITGSLVLYQNRLYVPLSSTEVLSAYNPQYPCCTFRGAVVALNATNGTQIWKTYTTNEPQPQQKNSAGVQNFGPSGAPVWSSPTIDVKRGLLYVGTGENYSRPASANSDAIIAMSLTDGSIKWVQQTIGQDAWNASCTMPNGTNCPNNHGPDFDFGAPPILVTGKQDMILAGQKSGMVYALNPDKNGEVVWQARAGRGGIMGGIHWGMATNNQTLYVPVNDREAWPQDKDKEALPGLHAFDIATGQRLWSMIEKNRCPQNLTWGCGPGLSAAITATPELVFGGALDGMIHAYSAVDGRVLWEFDSDRSFQTVNNETGYGGTIDSSGPVVIGNQMFVNSGYAKFSEKAGNILLCFEVMPPSTVKNIDRVSLSVNDLDQSSTFYQQSIGMKEGHRTSIKDMVDIEKAAGITHQNRKTAILQSPNAKIELIEFEGHKKTMSDMPIAGPGITHICYQSPTNHSIYAQAKANKATVVSRGNAPVDRGFGIQYAYIKDTDHIMFEVEQLDKPPFDQNHWIGHVALVTHDIDRLVEFYTQLLGRKPHNRIDNIKNSSKLDDIANIDSLKLRAAWFKVGNMQLEIWQFDNPKTIAASSPPDFAKIGYQKIVFEVTDITNDYQRMKTLGANFLSKPISSAVLLRDPDGNLLELTELK